MVNIIDMRPSKPGFDRRRKRRRQKETGNGGVSSESCSYWEGGDGTVIRQDGTVETPVRPGGTELDFGATEAVTAAETATASSASIVSSCTHPDTNSNASSSPHTAVASPTIISISQEVSPNDGASKHALYQESSSVLASIASVASASANIASSASCASSASVSAPAPAVASTPVRATATATSSATTTTVASPANKLQHQVDFLEEQLQIRSTEIELLQADLKHTKAQLADTAAAKVAATAKANVTAKATATATAAAHEQAIIEMQQEHIRQLQSLTDQYERSLQERGCRYERVLQQLKELSEQQQLSEQQLIAQREQLTQQDTKEHAFLKEWNQLQELQEKGVRDAREASVRYACQVQRYKDQLEGSDSKLLLAEQEIRLLKETLRQDLESVNEKYTKELRQQEHAHRRERAQMETNKAEEIVALKASLLEEVKEDLAALEEKRKHDLAQADETFHEILRERDARHQEEMKELQFALKAQTDEIADLTTSLRKQEDLGIGAQNALADMAEHNLQRMKTTSLREHDLDMKALENRMKEEYAADLRKRDGCHRGELEKLQGVIRTKTSEIAVMKESLHSVEDTYTVDSAYTVDSETTATDADRPVRRPFSHSESVQKPFGHSSQVLEVEVAELAIASKVLPPKTLPESPKVLKQLSPRIEASSAGKDPRRSDVNEIATAPEGPRRSSSKNPPAASARSRNGRHLSADSKQPQCSSGTPTASFDYRSAFAANSASRSLSQQWQSPSIGRDRSADSKQRKRPGVKLIPGASLTNPSSATSSRAGQRTPPRGRESVGKPRAAKKARIVIDSPGSDSDYTVFSNTKM